MFPKECKAILKTTDNSILEYGFASISLKNKYVEFTANFVPLLPIKTPVRIFCLESGQTTHIFSGNVYLSSKRLLRVVSIKCALMPGAEEVLSIETTLSAKFTARTIAGKFFPIQKWTDCTINTLSLNNISFTAPQIDTEFSDLLIMRIKSPLFSKNTEISLRAGKRSLMFGKSSRYNCEIIHISGNGRKEILDFIHKINVCSIQDIVEKYDNIKVQK